MYTVQHLAYRLGMTPKQVRKYLRSLGGYSSGVRYEFTHRELEQIVAQYNSRVASETNAVDPSAPGLPVSALRDSSQRARFLALREERLARLEQQVRASGIALGQLSNKSLIDTGRMNSLKEY
jgi:predicted transcriptional regulator